MKIKYTCPVTTSVDQTTARLKAENISHKVEYGDVIVFHGKPCRRAKEILTRAGFTRMS